MKTRKIAFSLILIFALILAACSAARKTSESNQRSMDTVVQEQAGVVEMPADAPVAMMGPPPAMGEADISKESAPQLQATSVPEGVGGGGAGNSGYVPAPASANPRLIIINGEMRLLVQDTDVAIDRATQVAADVGGYIVSSRVWFQQYGEKNYKYATLTLGIPVDEFERGLRRLRELAIRVLDENATGQDVTDEYVDLKSRLANLVATRDRIRIFLDRAETVEEALIINEQLSRVEADIEQVQGRMNYLFDRAAYSTVTVHIEPEILEPTPTPTPLPSPTPTPTPWSLQPTIDQAGNTLTGILRNLAEMGVWVGMVILPVLLPPLLLAWVAWRVAQRKRV